MKSPLKFLSELLSPADQELVEKTLARIDQQDTWNDVFSTKLIELLDNIDLLKSEIRERMRIAESVTHTATVSLERAETAHSQASQSTLEARGLLEDSGRQLDRARELEAAAELKQLSAARLLRTAGRYLALGLAVSWTATMWMAWFAVRPGVPLWLAYVVSVLIIVAAGLLARLVNHEA